MVVVPQDTIILLITIFYKGNEIVENTAPKDSLQQLILDDKINDFFDK